MRNDERIGKMTFQQWKKNSIVDTVHDFLKNEPSQACLTFTTEARHLFRESHKGSLTITNMIKDRVFTVFRSAANPYKKYTDMRNKAQALMDRADQTGKPLREFFEKLLELDELKSKVIGPRSTQELKEGLQKYKRLLEKLKSDAHSLDPAHILKLSIDQMFEETVKAVTSFIKGVDGTLSIFKRQIDMIRNKDKMKKLNQIHDFLNNLMKNWKENSNNSTATEINHIPAMKCYNDAFKLDSKLVTKYKNAHRKSLPHFERLLILDAGDNLHNTLRALIKRLIPKLLRSPKKLSDENKLTNVEVDFIRNNEDILASLLFDVDISNRFRPDDLKTIESRLELAYKPKHKLILLSSSAKLGDVLKQGFEKNTNKGQCQMCIQ